MKKGEAIKTAITGFPRDKKITYAIAAIKFKIIPEIKDGGSLYSIISFSDWEKLDLRNAEILEVEEIPGADKLYKLKIDLSTETRILVAGLKQYYTRDELVGKRVIIFINFVPVITTC